MTNTYNTNNPLGSTDPRDLYDNASNFDEGMNTNSPAFTDRLGVLRKSWNGMETEFNLAQSGRAAQFSQDQAERDDEFQAFLAASGFSFVGDYGAGLEFTNRSQYLVRDGLSYRLAPTTTLPYTTTGNWATEQSNFVLFPNEDVLRQDLASAAGLTYIGVPGGGTLAENAGSLLVGEVEEYRRALDEWAQDAANVFSFGAIGDGASHPLSERYLTLAEAQLVYPHATALTDEIDWCAIQGAINTQRGTVIVPGGTFVTSATIKLPFNSQRLIGFGRGKTIFSANFRGGAVVQIEHGRCSAWDFTITSKSGSPREAASPFGKTPPSALVDGNSADHGLVLREIANRWTYSDIKRVDINLQPAYGLALFGAGYCSNLDQIGITACGGHGIYGDNGGKLALTLGRNGIVDVSRCVIQGCWGDAVALGIYGPNTSFRYRLSQLDTFGNCLGDGGVNQPAFYDAGGAEIEANCEQLTIDSCAVGSNARGMNFGLSANLRILNPRFIDITTRGALINPNCNNIEIVNPTTFGVLPTVGFRVQSGCNNVTLRGALSSQWNTLIDAESEVRVLSGNQDAKTVPGSNLLFQETGVQSATVSSGVVDIRGSLVALTGEGDVADVVSQFRFASGVDVPSWYRFTVCNFRAYNITLGDRTVLGTGNLELRGTSAILEPGESLTFIANNGVYYAVGRGVA